MMTNPSYNQKLPEKLLRDIKNQFPPDFFTQSPEELKTYGKDWTRVFSPDPSALVLPRSTQEVSLFLQMCTESRVAVVPSGGRTGLAGGAVAAHGEVVLSLTRMNRMDPVDSLAQTVRVQAGALTQGVHDHCAPFHLIWPVDFASKGSSHVGGNLSTNAGGVKVIRYGLTRNWVLGLQVVTAEGKVLELNGALEKNNTGMDLRQLFIGTEGTLGVITEATLKLTRAAGTLDVFFFAVDGIQKVLELFQEARQAPFSVMAFEFLQGNCLDLVVEHRKLRVPFNQTYGTYVLLEIERFDVFDSSQSRHEEQLDAWLTRLFERGTVLDGTLAQSQREAKDLWTLREGISEALAARGFVHKNDIALPVSRLKNFIEEMDLIFNREGISSCPPLETYLFGHIGDGNLHVNTMKPDGMSQEEFIRCCHQTDLDLFALVQKHRGSISAEHGIGLLKKEALHFSRSPEELRFMKAMKAVFDPFNLLNPGKIF